MRIKLSLPVIALFLGLTALGAGIGVYTAKTHQAGQIAAGIDRFFWPDPKQIDAFTTVNHTGQEFNLNNLKGKWSFLFFGYTYCPDICPITMAVMNELHSRLANDDEGITDIQTVFVTVDPDRDTTERLAEYMGYFNRDFIGLGGTPEQINSLASQIGIVYLYGSPGEDGDYLVDHSSSVFLLDPEARLVSIFSAPQDIETLISRFSKIRHYIRQAG